MKRLISILLCLTMLVSCGISAMAASFSDVPVNNPYSEAIDVLSDFGIILGDAGSATFRPEAEISRAEFSVIVTRILAVSDLKADLNNLPFTDVTPESCDEWILNATKVAYDMGIVSGYGDGNFGPYNPVTYEQVVKMLVCALGYESSALESGGWPTGYLKVANDLRITDNAVMNTTGNAPRGIVAQLVYNCLEVDLMEKVNATDYEVKKGHNILTDKLGYTKGEGVITGIPGRAFTHAGKRINEGEVEIDGEIINAGTTNAKSFFGYRGEYYYKTKGAVKTLVTFKMDESNKNYVVNRDLIESIDQNGIEYLESEDAIKTTTFDFDEDTVFLYNGLSKDIEQIKKPNSGSVDMIDWDNDETIDVIQISDTRVVVVYAVDSAKKTITNKYDQNEKIVLDPEVTKVSITKNGAETPFYSIKKEDVLLIAENDKGLSVEIVTNTRQGDVTRVAENGEVYYIGDERLEVSPAYFEYMSKNSTEMLQVGDKATVYLNENGEILYSVRAELNAKVGYLIAVGTDEENERVQIKLLTFEGSGKIGIYNCDPKITINGARYDWDEVEDELKSTCSLTNKDEGAQGAETSQLIKYEMSSNGEIQAIYTMVENGDRERELVLDVPYTKDAVYQSTPRDFKDMRLSLSTTTTKVILVPSDRGSDEEYLVGAYNRLTGTKKYNIEAYDMSSTGVASYLVVYGSAATYSTSLPALLTEANVVQNSDGNNVYEIKVILNGKETKRQTKTRGVYTNADVKVGDIVRYKTNSKGIIEEIYKVFDPEDENFALLYPSKAAGKRYYTEGAKTTETNAEYLTICGTVYSRDEERFVLSLGTVNDEGEIEYREEYPDEKDKLLTILFSSGTKYFVYDKSESEMKRLTVDATKEYIMDYVDSGSGASKIMLYANKTNLRFVYIIVE